MTPRPPPGAKLQLFGGMLLVIEGTGALFFPSAAPTTLADAVLPAVAVFALALGTWQRGRGSYQRIR